ncbi:MAG: helix-turn-helix transcriptional regulator [Pseudomonadota bacterium]
MTNKRNNRNADLGMVQLLEKYFSGKEAIPVSVLADELNMRSETLINMWIAGKTKVPIHVLPAIAEVLGGSLADLLPLWIEQEAPEHQREEFREAAQSCSPASEMQLIHLARELYADGGEEWRDTTWLSSKQRS